MVIDKIQIVEALLFASDEPLTGKKIREIVPEVGTEKKLKKLIGEIDEKYEKQNSPFKIIELAGGFQIVTREEFSTWISQLYKSRTRAKLTRKGLETLAIVAYKQPITKIEVEKIRGVGSDGVIRTLIERNLITVRGREKAPGNPLLYGTTNYFLEYFSINDVSHLPKLKEIDELIKGDSKFLESLDQVALDQMMPEALGLNTQGGETESIEAGGQADLLENSENPTEEAPKNQTDDTNNDEQVNAEPSEEEGEKTE